eukprot:TRINITY_DN2928_c1_g1_i2.p1 TRINITY_DN2928_c1_g1~~TRINITY_DN2928_c1_g1_i2.p1  ORF type:complete len:1341 (+),score=297.08 TRINITY_DN2928_c1_g1_i2:119-4141(+)
MSISYDGLIDAWSKYVALNIHYGVEEGYLVNSESTFLIGKVGSISVTYHPVYTRLVQAFSSPSPSPPTSYETATLPVPYPPLLSTMDDAMMSWQPIDRWLAARVDVHVESLLASLNSLSSVTEHHTDAPHGQSPHTYVAGYNATLQCSLVDLSLSRTPPSGVNASSRDGDGDGEGVEVSDGGLVCSMTMSVDMVTSIDNDLYATLSHSIMREVTLMTTITTHRSRDILSRLGIEIQMEPMSLELSLPSCNLLFNILDKLHHRHPHHSPPTTITHIPPQHTTVKYLHGATSLFYNDINLLPYSSAPIFISTGTLTMSITQRWSPSSQSSSLALQPPPSSSSSSSSSSSPCILSPLSFQLSAIVGHLQIGLQSLPSSSHALSHPSSRPLLVDISSAITMPDPSTPSSPMATFSLSLTPTSSIMNGNIARMNCMWDENFVKQCHVTLLPLVHYTSSGGKAAPDLAPRPPLHLSRYLPNMEVGVTLTDFMCALYVSPHLFLPALILNLPNMEMRFGMPSTLLAESWCMRVSFQATASMHLVPAQSLSLLYHTPPSKDNIPPKYLVLAPTTFSMGISPTYRPSDTHYPHQTQAPSSHHHHHSRVHPQLQHPVPPHVLDINASLQPCNIHVSPTFISVVNALIQSLHSALHTVTLPHQPPPAVPRSVVLASPPSLAIDPNNVPVGKMTIVRVNAVIALPLFCVHVHLPYRTHPHQHQHHDSNDELPSSDPTLVFTMTSLSCSLSYDAHYSVGAALSSSPSSHSAILPLPWSLLRVLQGHHSDPPLDHVTLSCKIVSLTASISCPSSPEHRDVWSALDEGKLLVCMPPVSPMASALARAKKLQQKTPSYWFTLDLERSSTSNAPDHRSELIGSASVLSLKVVSHPVDLIMWGYPLVGLYNIMRMLIISAPQQPPQPHTPPLSSSPSSSSSISLASPAMTMTSLIPSLLACVDVSVTCALIRVLAPASSSPSTSLPHAQPLPTIVGQVGRIYIHTPPGTGSVEVLISDVQAYTIDYPSTSTTNNNNNNILKPDLDISRDTIIHPFDLCATTLATSDDGTSSTSPPSSSSSSLSSSSLDVSLYVDTVVVLISPTSMHRLLLLARYTSSSWSSSVIPTTASDNVHPAYIESRDLPPIRVCRNTKLTLSSRISRLNMYIGAPSPILDISCPLYVTTAEVILAYEARSDTITSLMHTHKVRLAVGDLEVSLLPSRYGNLDITGHATPDGRCLVLGRVLSSPSDKFVDVSLSIRTEEREDGEDASEPRHVTETKYGVSCEIASVFGYLDDAMITDIIDIILPYLGPANANVVGGVKDDGAPSSLRDKPSDVVSKTSTSPAAADIFKVSIQSSS